MKLVRFVGALILIFVWSAFGMDEKKSYFPIAKKDLPGVIERYQQLNILSTKITVEVEKNKKSGDANLRGRYKFSMLKEDD